MKAPMEKRLATCRVAKSAANEDGTYTFTITTPAVDRMGDSVEPLGGDFRAFKQNPVVLYGHDYSDLPVGRVESFEVSAMGVVAKVRFASEVDEFPARVERYVAAGFLKTVSIGFRVIEMEPIPEGRGYRIKRWELLELSIVPVPANAEAVIAAKGVGVLPVGETAPPETVNRVAIKAWCTPVAAAAETPAKDDPPAWVKALGERLKRIEEALGLDEEDNGDDLPAIGDGEESDPDEVDDSPALTEALAALDTGRIGE